MLRHPRLARARRIPGSGAEPAVEGAFHHRLQEPGLVRPEQHLLPVPATRVIGRPVIALARATSWRRKGASCGLYGGGRAPIVGAPPKQQSHHIMLARVRLLACLLLIPLAG